MKRKYRFWVVLVTLYASALLLAIYIGEHMIILAASASFFALSAGLLTNDHLDDDEKNRPSAMIRSFVPGLGHVYLRAYRRAILFSFGYLAIVLIVSGMLVLELEAILLLFSMFGIIIGMMFISLIDTEIVCNRLGLPYTGYAYEVRIHDYNLAFIASLTIAYAVGVILPVYGMVTGNSGNFVMNLTAAAAWSSVLLIGFVLFVVMKRMPCNQMI
ncbi:MAG: hypothetical protein LBJ20_08035 [Candidatus Methanoplasma sp.]|jgi:hypothetical protein|nr:hypothetical protein [Candidatus Methanoplasma sp.]